MALPGPPSASDSRSVRAVRSAALVDDLMGCGLDGLAPDCCAYKGWHRMTARAASAFLSRGSAACCKVGSGLYE